MKITYKIALISPVDFKRDKITFSRLNNELGCDDSPQRFESHLARILASFLTAGESSLGDLYIEGHRVGPAGVLDDELVLPVLLRRDLKQTIFELGFSPGLSALCASVVNPFCLLPSALTASPASRPSVPCTVSTAAAADPAPR